MGSSLLSYYPHALPNALKILGDIMTVRIVTDSACDISLDEAAQLNIKIVPLSIRFGEEEFTDLADISVTEFCCGQFPCLFPQEQMKVLLIQDSQFSLHK